MQSETGMPPSLEVIGVSKQYGAIHALKDIELTLRRGEVMALLGENGAGKSTLVKVLSGQVSPDAGSLRVNGEPADLSSSARSQAAGIAVVQQEYSLVRTMSVAENLVLGQIGGGIVSSPRALVRHARTVLDRVGLTELNPRTLVDDLSVAEMQLVEIGKALANEAQIVIFDEPTAALSDREIDRVLSLIEKLAQEGRSIIYITHRLPEVFRIADRVTVLRDGRNQGTLAVGDTDMDAVIELMLGRELTSMFPDRPDREQADVVLEVAGLMVEGLAEPVTFSVRAGEVLGLTGQLGSGASATVQGMAGMLRTGGGSVTLQGSPLSLRSRAAGIARGVAYCSSDRKHDGLFENLAVSENLSAPWLRKVATAGWVSRRGEAREARRSAEVFALDPARMRFEVANLSGGNQQKVALGKWVGTNPTVLLVDEPTRGVDVGARAEIYRQLRGLCDAGTAVVVSSSDSLEILGISDTIGTFYRGRLTGWGPRGDWTTQSVARQVMSAGGAA